MSHSSQSRPLIIGEVLFDCFSDRRVLGGAPFNVAWNLKGLGLDPQVLTAVGNDDFGAEILSEMHRWNMDRCGLQVLPGFPTGRVDVQISSGQPTYRFCDDVAFDHIQPFDIQKSAEQFGLLYHGSLALRASESRNAICQLRQHVSCPVFVDINIRQPHFSFKLFEPLLFNVDHLKLNDDELKYLTEQSTVAAATASYESWESLSRIARELKAKYKIKNLWLTAGSRGAAWIGPSGQYLRVNAPQVNNLVDAVGAGDALAAVIIRSILAGQPAKDALPLAVAYAARVCTLRGAITRDTSFYRPESMA